MNLFNHKVALQAKKGGPLAFCHAWGVFPTLKGQAKVKCVATECLSYPKEGSGADKMSWSSCRPCLHL